jgi:hypothetical protein
MKVQFKKQDVPMVKFSSEDDYIPFTLTFGNKTTLPEPIYTRNLNGENFIEFRFDSNDKSIYEITLVAIERNTIIPSEPFVSDVIEDGYFSCLTGGEIEAEYSLPIEILRSESSVCVNWYEKDKPPCKYYSLSQNCIFGVDVNNCLISIVLSGLSKDDTYNIFGF